MPDERLRRRVVEAIAQGLLPARLPRLTWGGFGGGGVCAACGRAVTAEQLETEFEDDHRVTFHLHIQCFAAWETVVGAGAASAEAALPLLECDSYSAAGDQLASSKGPK